MFEDGSFNFVCDNFKNYANLDGNETTKGNVVFNSSYNGNPLNGGSGVVDLLFCVLPVVCGGSAFVFVLVCIILCPF